MKIRRLPETDLARFAVMTPDKRRAALESQKSTYAPYSYDPMRALVPSIFNIEEPLFGRSFEQPWSVISKAIEAACRRGEDQRAANVMIAELLFKFAEDHSIKGRRRDFYPMSVGSAASIRFWSPMVISVDGKPIVPFIDPRKTKGLNAEARTFVFSVMHERIRVLEADFHNVGLGIFQFPSDGDSRKVKLYTDEGLSLFDFEMLDEMVRETYGLWWEILSERDAEKKRQDGRGEGWGPLFGTGL